MQKRKKLYIKRLLTDITFSLLELAENISQIGYLRPWLLPERRFETSFRSVNDPRAPSLYQRALGWLPSFDRLPTPQQNRFFMFSAALGMTAVIASALASLPRQPGLLYSVPAYAVLVVLVMLQRQRKIELLAA
jgi:hypothetical protein